MAVSPILLPLDAGQAALGFQARSVKGADLEAVDKRMLLGSEVSYLLLKTITI